MIYNTIDDVFAANGDVRRRILARVETLSDERAGARASEGAWSVSEIIEHLSITESRVARAIEGMLPQGDGAPPASSNFSPFSLDKYVEQVRDVKLEAPEFIRPRGLPLAQSLARLRESRAALEALRPRFYAADYSVLLQHPAFGPLNAAQWLAFVGMHEARHLAQIERTLETMNAER